MASLCCTLFVLTFLYISSLCWRGRQRDPPADCQALGGELLLALERDALCTTAGSITDPGSHVAHGGRPSLILDLISADCTSTRRARSTLIRTRSPTPRPRSSQPLERDELCALVDSTTDPGSHVAHGGRPSACAVFPPCPAVCSRPCLMCASPLRQPRSLVACTVACGSSVCLLARPLSVSAHQTEVTNLSRSHDAKAKHQTKQSSRAVAR